MKAERLQIRLEPAEKVLLERGAAAAHLDVSAFVRSAAASLAQQLLAERETIQLSAAAATAFAEALGRPATVNQRLAEALEHPRKFTWID